MRPHRSSLAFLVLLPLSLAAARPAAAETSAQLKLSLTDAEQMALSASPVLQAARARLLAGQDALRSSRGRMLPSLHVSEDYQHYSSPFAVTFPFAMAGAPAPTFTVRDQDINTFVVSADQPLLGLLRLTEEQRAQKRTSEAATAQLRVTAAIVRGRVRVGYIRHFEARALQDIARTAVRELTEQVTVAQAKLKAGVLTNADLLRVEVAVANAQQQELVAKTQADVARANVLVAIGRSPDDEGVELLEPTALLQESQRPPPSFRGAQQQSLTRRPELIQGKLLVEAAERQRRARLYSLLPEINAQAAYVRIDGQAFAPPDSLYVGLKAHWTVWDWGATYYAQRAARAQTEAAQLDVEAQRRQIASELAGDLAQSTAAASAVRLAEQTIKSAEEAYRVTNALLQAGVATTTDLLDSQSALTQARLNLTRAHYQQALAYVALSEAMGE